MKRALVLAPTLIVLLATGDPRAQETPRLGGVLREQWVRRALRPVTDIHHVLSPSVSVSEPAPSCQPARGRWHSTLSYPGTRSEPRRRRSPGERA